MTLLNPTDDSVLTTKVQVASAVDVNKAVDIASQAFLSGPWSSFTGAKRASCLLKVADLIEKHASNLARLESLPTGRPVSGILGFDIPHMVEVFRCELAALLVAKTIKH